MNWALFFRLLPAGCLLAAHVSCTTDPLSNSQVAVGGNSGAPSISNATVQGVLVLEQSTAVNVTATVTDSGVPVRSVTVDLTQIGGSAEEPLSQVGEDVWTFSGSVTPAIAGTRMVALVAADDAGGVAAATANTQVYAVAPEIPDSPPPATVEGQKHPLGGSTELTASTVSKVYVPSRYGGELTVSGAAVQLIYTDGLDLQPGQAARILQGAFDGSIVAQGSPCTYTVPEGKHGWYYIRPSASTPVRVYSTFIEAGQASYRPWNGWWWAWNSTGGPTLYDPGGPLDKYDRVYKTRARPWNEDNEQGGEWWWGHCWGWSIASILLPEPRAVTKDAVAFTRDDMKALYTELADTDPYYDPDLSIADIPPGPPTAAAGEDIDGWCDEVHRILRTCIREDRAAVQADMRAIAVPPDRQEEVWNQAIYKYTASFQEVPGVGNEHVVRIEIQVWSNYDLDPPPTDNSRDRLERFVYDLEFNAQGEVVTHSPQQNWINTSHYPPRDLHRLTGSPWSARNPYVTKARVDAITKG